MKLADIADNSAPERLALLDPATRRRLRKKYRLALGILLPGPDETEIPETAPAPDDPGTAPAKELDPR